MLFNNVWLKLSYIDYVLKSVHVIISETVKGPKYNQWLMLSAAKCDHIPKVLFTKEFNIKATKCCDNSVNVITFCLS